MRFIAILRWAGLVAFASTVAVGVRAENPAQKTLSVELPAFEAPTSPGAPFPSAPPEPTGVLRLEDALASALLRNADLAADAYEIRAREAALLQAGARPNPSVSLELEDFAGSGAFSGADNAQTTLLLGQLIELGGKRAARIGVATADRELAAWDYEVRRIDVLVRTADAFVDVLAAQERRRLASEALELARSLERVAAARLRAGLASPAEQIRSGVQVDVAEVEREHTKHGLATARQTLAAAWAGEAARFERAEGDLERLPRVPTLDELTRRLETSPAFVRWQTELALRDALRAHAKSNRAPDVTVRLGPRWFSGPDDTTLVAGLSLPLPLWDRRRGAIEETEFRRSKLTAESRASRTRSVAELAIARVGLEASAEEAHLLLTRVIPGTERALETLRSGYAQGRFTQIEVIDAERAMLAAREQYLSALTEAHHNAQKIERLTGVPLEVRP